MTARTALHVLRAEGLVDAVQGRDSFVADPLPRDAVSEQSPDADRIEVLTETLRDVLDRIRPQRHLSWKLNTCLLSNNQLTKWWRRSVSPLTGTLSSAAASATACAASAPPPCPKPGEKQDRQPQRLGPVAAASQAAGSRAAHGLPSTTQSAQVVLAGPASDQGADLLEPVFRCLLSCRREVGSSYLPVVP